MLEARTPDILERLDDIDPVIAKELRQYLQFWGLRPIGPEAGCPTVADQPHLVADLIADLLSDDGRATCRRPEWHSWRRLERS